MPVTDLSGGDDDWLQQFLAGHQAGQAYGASQSYGPGGVPGPYSGGPRGVMPGGGLMDRLGATPGAPSMGYPAMGQATAQQPPATAPGPAQGLSLSNNPIAHALNYLNPIGSAQADILHPNLSHPNLANPMGVNQAAAASPLLRAGAADSLPLAYGNPTGQDYQNWLTSQLSGTAPGASPAATATANPNGRGGYGGVPPGGWDASATPWFTPSNNPMPWRKDPSALPKSDPNAPPGRRTYVGQPPGGGAPTGQPSQTPTPPQGAQSARFGTIQYQTPNSSAARAPIYTALNLFGGGQAQPAANPANLPAPNAQTVSGPLAQGGMSNAPWWMGPFQQGVFGPSARDLAAAKARSGYQ